MNSDAFEPDPRGKWKRKNYDLSKLNGLQPRERAELETNRDLEKPLEQLVCDFHDIAEIILAKSSGQDNDPRADAIQAEKRMVSLMGRVALEHKRSSDLLVWFTVALVAMTAVLIWLTVVLISHEKPEPEKAVDAAEAQQYNQQVQAQIKRGKRAEQMLREQEEQHKRVEALLKKQEELFEKQPPQLDRVSEILKGWEKQQKEYQQYLDALQKK